MNFYAHDVAIVSYSGVFSEWDNEDEFYSGILEKKCTIRDLTADSVDDISVIFLKNHYSADRGEANKTYSRFGSLIPIQKIKTWAKRHELDPSVSNAFEIIMHELLARIDTRTPDLFRSMKTEAVIAVSTGDSWSNRLPAIRLIKKMAEELPLRPDEKERVDRYVDVLFQNTPRLESLLKDYFWVLSFETVRDRFGIQGPCAFVDAACASSLASFMVAVDRLRAHETDLVIAGGIDLGVSALTLSAFSKVQVLSSGVMNPFDVSADGMNQGEAASLFALMRLKDARDRGLPVLGVIRNCDGSSDGVNGGMVEPTERGQMLAYERAYRDVPLHDLTYLECHGTGTKIGDKTELSSTAKYFHPLPPIGSVKANIGHTIGAAGAASLAKALKIIETRKLPPMPRFQSGHSNFPHRVPTAPEPIPSEQQIRVGISSFGFGGTNFHLVVDEYRNEPIQASAEDSGFRFLFNGMAEVDLEYVFDLVAASPVKIPPISLPHYDPAIIGGVLATEKLLQSLGVKLSPHLREQVSVFSTSNNYLERFLDSHDRAALLEILARLNPGASEARERLNELLAAYLPITEDTFPGALNNLIAGRITKDFDFKGVNFNISGEQSSLGLAMSYARARLRSSSGAVIIVHSGEDVSAKHKRIERKFSQAWMVSDQAFALKANLPIAREITDIVSQRLESVHVQP